MFVSVEILQVLNIANDPVVTTRSLNIYRA